MAVRCDAIKHVPGARAPDRSRWRIKKLTTSSQATNSELSIINAAATGNQFPMYSAYNKIKTANIVPASQ